MKIEKAIITGATGAIGTALINELIIRNIEVLIFTRADSKRNNIIPKNDLIKIQYTDLSEIRDVKNDSDDKYDIFFHLAWMGTSGNGRNDETIQKKNIEYTFDALRCAKRFNCKKFIGIGSQAEYGRKNEALTATLPCNPENEYGKAKLEAGTKGKKLALDLKIDFNWIRVLSIYGPNDGENSLISYLVRSFKNRESPKLTKCEQIWDYLYSADAAKAIYLIGKDGIDGKTYVLGSGKSEFLKKYVEIIRSIISPETAIDYGSIPYSDKQVMYLAADISEIKKDVNWSPETSFNDGVLSIINCNH